MGERGTQRRVVADVEDVPPLEEDVEHSVNEVDTLLEMPYSGRRTVWVHALSVAVLIGFVALLLCSRGVLPRQTGNSSGVKTVQDWETQSANIILRPWEEAKTMAVSTEEKMTDDERRSMIGGTGFLTPDLGYWASTIPAIPRLGVPALKLQDSGGGFRPTAPNEFGTTTSWPSLLGLGATWDEALVGRVSSAIAKEFRGKGASVLLGPGINVHRTARGGRNFEYMSGEDPFLGARLARAYIQNVQREGIMAVAKHFAFNEQEAERHTENSVVDEKTAWELYYPPFEAAVEAGVGAFMCSYNKVNGIHACSNEDLLRGDLKGTMGFEGFVMSDWGGTTNKQALPAGLDVEEPKPLYLSSAPAFAEGGYKTAECPSGSVPATLDECKEYAAGLFHQGPCKGNDGYQDSCESSNKTNQKWWCASKPLGCWQDMNNCVLYKGAGRNKKYHSSRPVCVKARSGNSLDSGLVRAAATRILTSLYHLRLDENPGCEPPCTQERSSNQRSPEHVQLAREAASAGVVLLSNNGVLPLSPAVKVIAVVGAAATARDHLVVWGTGSPYAGGGSGHIPAPDVVTPLEGIKARAERAGIFVHYHNGYNIYAATKMAKAADVVIVVAATTTWESQDRHSLHLDGAYEKLIKALARVKPTVALLEVPGVVLTPFRNDVSALACMFLGGEQTGAAWADVVFGDVAPAGKLPITLPASEEGLVEPSSGEVVYAEKLMTGYRSPRIQVAFPFGHGLTYTKFSLSEPEQFNNCSVAACIKVRMTNVGQRAGRELVQAYLEFPEEVGEPKRILRGFQRSVLLSPGEEEEFLFTFTPRDLSTYVVGSGWMQQSSVVVHVGFSSEQSGHKSVSLETDSPALGRYASLQDA